MSGDDDGDGSYGDMSIDSVPLHTIFINHNIDNDKIITCL